MTTMTAYEHVALDEQNVARVEGTTTKVVELVADQEAYGWSPEEMHFQHPELTLGQIHSALAYYWDHHKELDADLREQLKRVACLRDQAAASPLQRRLRRQG